MVTEYWNKTDEELLKEVYTDPNSTAISVELAIRLERRIDVEDEAPEAPEWARKLCEDE